MKTADVRDLALKLFGLNLGLKSVHSLYQSITSCVAVFREAQSVIEEANYLAHRPLYVVLVFLWPLFYFTLTYFFLFRTSAVASLLWPRESEERQSEGSAAIPGIAFWITVSGIFFLIQSAGGFVSELWVFALRRQAWESYMSLKHIPDMVTFPVSVLAIVKATTIERCIQTYRGKKTPNQASHAISDSAPSADSSSHEG